LLFRERAANIDELFCPSSMVLTQTSHFATHTLTLLDQVAISHKYQLVPLWLPWRNTSWKTTAKWMINSQHNLTLLELKQWDNVKLFIAQLLIAFVFVLLKFWLFVGKDSRGTIELETEGVALTFVMILNWSLDARFFKQLYVNCLRLACETNCLVRWS